MIKTLLLAMILTGPFTVGAQELPTKPAANTEFKIEAATLGSAWLLDTISTHEAWVKCSTCIERGGFWNGSRNTPKIMASWAAVDLGAIVLSYEWKRHIHNRYLQPLWRVPLLFGTQMHLTAAIGNANLPSTRQVIPIQVFGAQ